jgi:hypothetical protein
MVCSCGASCRSSETKEGEVFTCPKCGRREVKLVLSEAALEAALIKIAAAGKPVGFTPTHYRPATDFSAGSPPQASAPFALSMEPIEMPKRRRR